MATNVLAAQGLLYSRNKLGATGNAQENLFYIRNGYTASNIALGDLVKTGTSTNQGYIIPSALNDTSGLGVFAGVLPYYDKTFQQTVHGLNGSFQTSANPAADIPCLVINDMFAIFRIQATGGPYTVSMRGQNCNWLTGTNAAPNAAGISTLTLDLGSVATTNTLPLRIEGVSGVPGGPQDPANTNPLIDVSFNPNWIEGLLGTGI